jgi:hypothetical protein
MCSQPILWLFKHVFRVCIALVGGALGEGESDKRGSGESPVAPLWPQYQPHHGLRKSNTFGI